MDVAFQRTDDSPLPNIKKQKNLQGIGHNELDAIFLLDVLEHIEEDDVSFLKDLLPFLKNEGTLIITVPAFSFLYSDHDRFLKHFRRYGKAQLLTVLSLADVKVRRIFYFYTSLFFIRLMMLLISKLHKMPVQQKGIGCWNFPESSMVTRIFRNILNFDFFVNMMISQIKITLPGLSLCVICQKKSQ